ncbi:DUF397 domain-containing protein [Actinomadura hibisca]|uniref:DUF397 domain-containing protein n=1 Tax=Actinomadura hibisca TaxID=68565 RepID=UPI001FE0ABEE|nr:DUF397 domain-containing protein [Actinomadura hibisca]
MPAFEAADWRKSSRCGGTGTCVEVARLDPSQIGARDTKRGAAGPVLQFSAAEWRTFTDRVKRGELDLSS